MQTDVLRRFPVFLAAAAITACGGGEGGAGGEAGGEGAPAPAPAPAATVDPATVGTVSGVVNFTGSPPAAEPIDMAEEQACAAAYGDAGPMTQNVLVQNGRLANVFVRVTSGYSGTPPAATGQPVLDQQNCRYTPHVLGVRVGQDLTIRNSDDLLHNINANPQNNRGFNISQPRAGMTRSVSFSTPEVMIPVRCDVHGWMSAYVGVINHPFFAVSGTDGSFRIPNLPPGDYVLEAWHEQYGTRTANVTVAAQATAEVSFEYSAGAAAADVPLGRPLVIRHGENGIEVERVGEAPGAGN